MEKDFPVLTHSGLYGGLYEKWKDLWLVDWFNDAANESSSKPPGSKTEANRLAISLT